MQQGLTLATLICMSAFVRDAKATAPAANDARREFTTLCAAWAAMESALKIPMEQETVPEAFAEIAAINISVAGTDWHQQIKAVKDSSGWETFKKKDNGKWDSLFWDEIMPIWIAAYDKVHAANNQWYKEHPRPTNTAPAEAVRHAINVSASLAYQKRLTITKAGQDATGAPLAARYKQQLSEAICGKAEYSSSDGNGKCKDISATPAKDTICTQANAGKALKLDLLCLCENDAAEVCKAAYKTNLISAANLQRNSLAAATACCPQKEHTAITIEHLTTAVGAVRALIGHDTDLSTAVTVLGKLNTAATDCSHSSNGACVDYTTYYAAPKTGFDSIPWVAAADGAVATYKRFQVQKQAAAQAKIR
uniref:Variant surface glycoprotein 1561 n=1 Tax=Trypanosoma brucei TaxID=5691 RepID=M4TBX0_9TRYP|nr:variant surface glycoprotein 1561 [Trypanosoma brucei]